MKPPKEKPFFTSANTGENNTTPQNPINAFLNKTAKHLRFDLKRATKKIRKILNPFAKASAPSSKENITAHTQVRATPVVDTTNDIAYQLDLFKAYFIKKHFQHGVLIGSSTDDLPIDNTYNIESNYQALQDQVIQILANQEALRQQFFVDLEKRIQLIRENPFFIKFNTFFQANPEVQLLQAIHQYQFEKEYQLLEKVLQHELNAVESIRRDELPQKAASFLKNPTHTSKKRIDCLAQIEAAEGNMLVTEENIELTKKTKDVIFERLHQIDYHYAHLTAGKGRQHRYSLTQTLFQESGDKIKSEILLDFKVKLDACLSEDEIDAFVEKFKTSSAYTDYIQQAQGWFTATFGTKKLGNRLGIKTSSEQAIEDMIDDAKQKNLNNSL